MARKLYIDRLVEGNKQSLGQFLVKEDGKVLAKGVTLELPNRYNQVNVSNIPTGVYSAQKSYNLHGNPVFDILNVPGRSGIEVHAGNFNTDIQGCILVGSYFSDLNKDGYYDVTSSVATMRVLLDLLPDKFEVSIKKKLV